MTEPSCARMGDLAAELALGVLPGDERAEAVDHLAACPECRTLVRELTTIGDDLLGLAPVGYRTRRLRPRRWLPMASAAAVAAVVFGVSGWLIGSTPGPGDLRTANLVAADRSTVGQVFSYPGNPAWVYMVVRNTGRTGEVRCELERRNGAPVTIGAFPLTDGYGGWGGQDPVDPHSVIGAKLLLPDGTVLAQATF
jgi:hypothetical protein